LKSVDQLWGEDWIDGLFVRDNPCLGRPKLNQLSKQKATLLDLVGARMDDFLPSLSSKEYIATHGDAKVIDALPVVCP
jgi:hypothetical protein